jgi:hypothetical protein
MRLPFQSKQNEAMYKWSEAWPIQTDIRFRDSLQQSPSSSMHYEVEDIVGKKIVKGKVFYLVKWKGWQT